MVWKNIEPYNGKREHVLNNESSRVLIKCGRFLPLW